MRVDSWASTLCNPSLSAACMSTWTSQAHAFHQPVCQKLSWLHHWSIPCVHTSGAFSPSEWDLDLQCQAVQVAHWIWWWQCLGAWHCRSVIIALSFRCWSWRFGFVKCHWHGAFCSTHKSCTRGHVSWKGGGGKRELVAASWTSSRWFSHVLWLKVHSRRLLRACLLGSKRKLPPPVCQVPLGPSSVVYRPRGMQFPGTMYIWNQGPLSSAWAHCISCAPSAYSHCRRCCCCPLQCDRRCMETHLNSAVGPSPYHRSWSLSFLHFLSFLSPPLLLSKSRASRHIPWGIQRC